MPDMTAFPAENRPKTILLVEDEALIALNEAHVLREQGFSVITVSNGPAAIEKALATPDLDMILMDIDLGRGMDGAEAAQHILRQRNLPVLFLSSHTEPEVVAKTEAITSYGYVVKFSGETVLLASIKMAFKLFEAHRAIQQNQAALRESEAQIRSISNNLLYGMIYQVLRLPDGSRKFTYISDTVERLYGVTAQEVMADAMLIYRNVHPDDRQRVWQEEEEANRNLSPFKSEVRMLTPTGAIRWSAFVSCPRRLEDGTTRWDGIEFDITALKEAEAEIRRLNSELEQRVAERTAQLEAINKDLERFVYVTSHDLKAPLRAISRLAEWLVQDYANILDGKGQELCALLSGRVKRMGALIDGILEYSRIGRVVGANEPADIAAIVADVLELLAPPETIRITLTSDLPVVTGDTTRLTQVFQNLLSNAIHFMGKPEGQIAIGCTEDDTYWTFSVADTGPGIPPQHHERIFQMFQTLQARDEYESTGIGLAIVKKIVELHGGTVWVESEAGAGSTFYFTLPKKML